MVSTAHERSTTSATAATYVMDVYFDYACPFAWAAQVWLDDVKDALGDDMQVTWRYFPLEQANAADPEFRVWEQPNDGTSSTLRSLQASWAGRQQGEDAFRRMHAALFRKRHVEGRNLGGQAVLEAAAVEAGLDLERFQEDLRSDAVFAEIQRDYTHAREYHEVFGTPTIIFDNDEGAYLKLNFQDMPADPVEFFLDFVRTVRERPSVIEIKRPKPMGK